MFSAFAYQPKKKRRIAGGTCERRKLENLRCLQANNTEQSESYELRTLISNAPVLLAHRVISAAAAAAAGLTTEQRQAAATTAEQRHTARLSVGLVSRWLSRRPTDRPGRSSFPCCYIIHAAVRLRG